MKQQSIQKFRLKAVGGIIDTVEVPMNSDVFAVMQDGNDIALYATVDRADRDAEIRTFAMVPTGSDFPEIDGDPEKLYVGSVSFVHSFEQNGVAVIRDTPFELHVWEIGPPPWQSRPRMERIDFEVTS